MKDLLKTPKFKRKTQIGDDEMKAQLRGLLAQGNLTIYTVLVNKVDKSLKSVQRRYVSVFLVIGGDMINISLFTARVIGVDAKRLLSDFLVVTEIEEAGYFIKSRLQAEMNRGTFMKVEIRQQWR